MLARLLGKVVASYGLQRLQVACRVFCGMHVGAEAVWWVAHLSWGPGNLMRHSKAESTCRSRIFPPGLQTRAICRSTCAEHGQDRMK